MPFEEVPHTGDFYLKVTGKSLEELFVDAAKGMFSFLGEREESGGEFEVEVEASSKEELLVKWLEELVAEHEISGNIFTDFQVEIEDNKLKGKAKGGKGDIKKAIKGVTFFELEIVQKNGEYKTRILFDI